MDIAEQVLKCRTFAVAGASNDPRKYGNIVFRRLLGCGYEVYPINPNAGQVDGHPCYASLDRLPRTPEVVICVTPPAVTQEIAGQCASPRIQSIRFFWTQPGAESPEAAGICRKVGITVADGRCILQELSRY